MLNVILILVAILAIIKRKKKLVIACLIIFMLLNLISCATLHFIIPDYASGTISLVGNGSLF